MKCSFTPSEGHDCQVELVADGGAHRHIARQDQHFRQRDRRFLRPASTMTSGGGAMFFAT